MPDNDRIPPDRRSTMVFRLPDGMARLHGTQLTPDLVGEIGWAFWRECRTWHKGMRYLVALQVK